MKFRGLIDTTKIIKGIDYDGFIPNEVFYSKEQERICINVSKKTDWTMIPFFYSNNFRNGNKELNAPVVDTRVNGGYLDSEINEMLKAFKSDIDVFNSIQREL